jgi:hypothetical protein
MIKFVGITHINKTCCIGETRKLLASASHFRFRFCSNFFHCIRCASVCANQKKKESFRPLREWSRNPNSCVDRDRKWKLTRILFRFKTDLLALRGGNQSRISPTRNARCGTARSCNLNSNRIGDAHTHAHALGELAKRATPRGKLESRRYSR